MKTFKNATKLSKMLTYNLKGRTVSVLETPLKELRMIRNTPKGIENDLKEHEDKINRQINSDKGVDPKIKILNTLESFQDN